MTDDQNGVRRRQFLTEDEMKDLLANAGEGTPTIAAEAQTDVSE